MYILEVCGMNIEVEREEDARWIAEIPDLPGVMVYGQSRAEAKGQSFGFACSG